MDQQLVPTTELEAVNILLDTISEAPVSTLEDTGLVDVAVARQRLREVSRSVQSKGWDFNSEPDYPLPLTTTGEIEVPPNALRVNTSGYFKHSKIVQRGSRLYDKENHTYKFEKPVTVDIIFLLPFNELPEAARYYITVRAARIFQDRIQGSDGDHQYTAQDEMDALVTLKEAEGDTGDYNILRGSNSVASILER